MPIEVEEQAKAKNGLFVYVIPPIDLWFGWKNLAKVRADGHFPDEGMSSIRHNQRKKAWRIETDRLLFEGRKWAQQNLGYAGDIERGPFLSFLPGKAEIVPLVAWESVDRELVFVASPVPLPHLDELQKEVAEVRAAPPAQKDNGPFGRSPFPREE